MKPHADSARTPREKPLEHDNASTTPPAHTPAHTKQTELDEREKRRHDASESALPSSQEKNPVPPDSTDSTRR